jgi:hypothetical protein
MSTSTTRRAVLAGTAGALALGASANTAAIVAAKSAEADADPILAAIEVHREAWARFDRSVEEQSRLEGELNFDDRRWSPCYGEDLTPPPGTDPQWAAAVIEWHAAADAHDDACYGLINVHPTTIAGMVALIDHVVNHSIEADVESWPEHVSVDWDEEEDEQPFLVVLLNELSIALEAIAERSMRS